MTVEHPQQPGADWPPVDVRPPLPQGQVYDEIGRAICKFPPFPIPPASVKIKSFAEFAPSGLRVRLDEELATDGSGIPTVLLSKQHDNENASSSRKKKRKITKTLPTGEVITRASTWWEDWEAGEGQRIRSAKKYDPNTHQLDRLALVVEDFVRAHPLADNQELFKWWEKFQRFLGFYEVNVKPRFRRPFQEPEEEEEFENDSDPEAIMTKPEESKDPSPPPSTAPVVERSYSPPPPNQSSFESDETFMARVNREKTKREILSQSFLEDPAQAVRVFFTSYFFRLGLYAEPKACHRIPRLVQFFLSYVIGTRALPEQTIALKNALKIAEQARLELPLTGHIGRNVPDKLGRCLTETFGSRAKEDDWILPEWNPKADANEGARVEEILEDSTAKAPKDAVGSWGESNANGSWGEATGAWGDVGGEWGTTQGDLGTEIAKEARISDWMDLDTPSLTDVLGTTTLSETHTIGYVEESTRSITKITLASTTATQGQKGVTLKDSLDTYAKIELKSYPSSSGPVGPHDVVQQPELLEDPNSKSDGEKAMQTPIHDPTKDIITILLDAKLAEEIKESVGVGLKGIFVQVVPKVDETGRARGKGKDGNLIFWYAEKLHQIIPSLWAELGDYDRVFNDDLGSE